MKKLTKFTNVNNNQKIYIDLDTVVGIDEYKRLNTAGSDYTAPINQDVTYCTRIYSGQVIFHITEHISEVLAYIEGRDPSASQIMFGNKPK